MLCRLLQVVALACKGEDKVVNRKLTMLQARVRCVSLCPCRFVVVAWWPLCFRVPLVLSVLQRTSSLSERPANTWHVGGAAKEAFMHSCVCDSAYSCVCDSAYSHVSKLQVDRYIDIG